MTRWFEAFISLNLPASPLIPVIRQLLIGISFDSRSFGAGAVAEQVGFLSTAQRWNWLVSGGTGRGIVCGRILRGRAEVSNA